MLYIINDRLVSDLCKVSGSHKYTYLVYKSPKIYCSNVKVFSNYVTSSFELSFDVV